MFLFQDQLYDILPGMELTPTNPITLKPQKTSTQVQYGWMFVLHMILLQDFETVCWETLKLFTCNLG